MPPIDPQQKLKSAAKPPQPDTLAPDEAATTDGYAAPPEETDGGIPSTIGIYKIEKLLGQGGMGAVYLAEDPSLQRKVALKVMKASFAENPTAKERFFREARAAARVESDHIIRVYQVGEDRGMPFIAMEYLKGKPMDVWMKEARPTVKQVLRIGFEAAQGLSAAHKAGLIHRDIKPANLWLEAPAGRVKVLDFGLARPSDENVQLTNTGVVVGTPAYMSPEQGRGKDVDHRTDIFSLGCVLYQLATGKRPFRGNTSYEIIANLIAEVPEPPAAVNPQIPVALSDAIMQMLEKDAAKRPDKARSVAEAMVKIQRDMDKPLEYVPTPLEVPMPVNAGSTTVWDHLEESGMEAPPKTEPAKTPPRQPQNAVGGGSRRKLKIGGALFGLLALITAGVIIIKITNKDGSVTELKVPDGIKIEVMMDGKTILQVPSEPKSEFIPLFNGKDLTGWKLRTRDSGNWRVEKGILKGSGNQTYLFTERGDYADFHLRAETRINSAGSGGLEGRAQYDGGAVPALGYQAKINDDRSPDPRKTGSLYVIEKGTWQRGVAIDKSPVKPDEWFTMDLIVEGNRVIIKVNGTTTTDFVDEKKLYMSGSVALQVHNQSAQIEFRKIEIRELKAKRISNFNEPAFQKWMKDVQALPAEKQVEEVAKKLQELNPGFDGKLGGKYADGTPKIENGVVTELGFVTDDVTDIAPVRALAGLKALRFSSSSQYSGKLADLSPLQGLALTSLEFGGNKVADLAPLKGMPLTFLQCGDTKVSDLSPLEGMKLTTLHCQNDTKLTDLSPLKGMPLTTLGIVNTKVADLSVLSGMPLTRLECHATKISDLTPLAGMKLTFFSCNNTAVSDLSPLKGMPLASLYCSNTMVSDVTPLEDCKALKTLSIAKAKVTAAAVAALQKALPNCKIAWDAPAAEPEK